MTQETNIEPRSRALAYELMGVLADVDHAGIGAFDWVCYRTVKRVMEELLVQDATNVADEPLSKKQIAAYTQVITSLEARLSALQGRSQQSLEAVKTLQSERDANAILTEEVVRLTAERTMPESVPDLVKRLRYAVVDEYEGTITLDEIANEAADALEEAYGVAPVKITHVAIQYDGKVYSLPAPNRHNNVIRKIAEENGAGVKGPDIQGFVDSTGRFLNRRDAYKVAFYNGQLNRRPGGYQGSELYSEDLW